MLKKPAATLIATFALALTAWAVTPIDSVTQLTPQRIGEFVTISGTAENFHAPSSHKEPYSFRLRDSAGHTIRVFAWPDTMTVIKGWQDLKTSGTSVQLTAEVTDHDGEFELQILDREEIKIGTRQASDAKTTATAILTSAATLTKTAPANTKTTGSR